MVITKKGLFSMVGIFLFIAGGALYSSYSNTAVKEGARQTSPRIDPDLFTIEDTEPALTTDQMLMSQLCTASQFDTSIYKKWCSEIKEEPRLHRKQWEFVVILQALSERGMLQEGKRGIGFGVGQEPLPAVFANHGVEILATDLDLEGAIETGWAQSAQHMTSTEVLNKKGIAPDETFNKLVKTMTVDMNNIPDTLQDFDFTWSSCAFEHLGGIDKGLEFVENSLKILKPGGIAVHTTEYNLSSNDKTMDTGGTVLFRKQDIQQLVKKLTSEGHEVYVNYNPGSQEIDQYIDHPPYGSVGKHLKLALGEYVTTSIALIVRKKM